MVTETDDLTTAKRRLILRDSAAFLSLIAITAVLFGVTLFLFRSFSSHRADLAVRWSGRGRQAMTAGKPDQAIVALRTALSYAPGTREYELLLAQALGEAGHTDESYNYFMGLWETEPGNGFTNLQLARLAAKKGDRRSAVNFYRASIYGTWEGDGVARRSQVRLELARYLIEGNELPAARMELLIAGGNAPDNPDFDLALGQELEQAGDPVDASTYYQKALALRPQDHNALEAAGRIAYHAGDYMSARRLLGRAVATAEPAASPDARLAEDETLMHNATRILELTPSHTLPARERAQRIVAARDLAHKRFDACTAQFPDASLPSPLQDLTSRWAEIKDDVGSTAALLRDPDQQDAQLQLTYDTEVETSKLCGAPTGDDALLLLLANAAQTSAAGQGTE